MKHTVLMARLVFVLLFMAACSSPGHRYLTPRVPDVTIPEGKRLTLPLNCESTAMVVVTVTNTAEGEALFVTSSSLNGEELSDTEQGPADFRTSRLTSQGETIQKAFICNNKDLLVITVLRGQVSVNAEPVNR